MVLFGYALMALCLQVFGTGAVFSELGAYSDEPAHYVTAVMLRDYVTEGFPREPMAFANEFYARFPKVALGHWPPGFYLVQLPLLLIADSPAAATALVALLAGLSAGILVLILCRVFPLPAAFGIGLVWLFIPLVLSLSGMIMTEVPLALVTVLALAVWQKFLERHRLVDAILFGVIVGVGLLIKVSAVGLLAIPVAAGHALGTRRDVYVSRGFAVAVALLIGAPWSLYFFEQTRGDALYTQLTLEYTTRAVPFFFGGMAQALGWTVTGGVVAWVGVLIALRGRMSPLEETAASALIGLVGVLLVVPGGLEQRYWLPAVPPLLILSSFGYRSVIAVLTGRRTGWVAAALIAGAMVESVAVHGVPRHGIAGYRDAVQRASSACDTNCVLLVISDANGEGTFVSEAVQLRRRGDLRVLRGTKVLSSSDWAGRNYKPLVQSPADVTALVDQYGVDYVLVDSAAGQILEAELVAGALVRPDFDVAFEVPVRRFADFTTHRRRQLGQVTVYRNHRPSAALHR